MSNWENGFTILPITHEDAVLDNDGKNISSKYQPKEDESLLTNAKTIVGAINELSSRHSGSTDDGSSDNTSHDCNLSTVEYNEGTELTFVYNVTEVEERVTEVEERVTEIEDNVISSINTQMGTLSNLQTTNKDNLVDAVNELFQNVDNGKNLIATSIGEPLSAEDTFQAMSDDINGLLRTFKTNMMNNGITVESGDKFKSLIDKVKDIDNINDVSLSVIASDEVICSSYLESQYAKTNNFTFNCYIPGSIRIKVTKSSENGTITLEHIRGSEIILNQTISTTTMDLDVLYGDVVKITGSMLGNDTATRILSICGNFILNENTNENTTLRDSLASILTEEGISVTEEDDMASLITKVDEEFDRKNANSGLDIISATELPATGEENQICVIMDEPCDNFIITPESSPTLTEPTVILHTSSSGNAVTLTNGNITTCLLFDSVYMDSNKYASYVYESSQWKQLTFLNLPILTNGIAITNVIGSFNGSSAINYSEGYGIYCSGGTAGLYSICSWNNKISFDNYSTIKFTAYVSTDTYSSNIVFAQSNILLSTTDSNSVTNFISSTCKYSSTFSIDNTTATEYTIDISSWTGTYYLALQVYQTLAYTYITNIELI